MEKRANWILLLVALGMVALAVEVRYEHRAELNEYWQMWVPIVAGIIGFFFAFAAAVSSKLRLPSALVLAGIAVVGPAGVWFHTEGDPTELAKMLALDRIVAHASEGEEGEGNEEYSREAEGDEGEEAEAPSGAPMSFSGLALIGAIAAWPTGKKR